MQKFVGIMRRIFIVFVSSSIALGLDCTNGEIKRQHANNSTYVGCFDLDKNCFEEDCGYTYDPAMDIGKCMDFCASRPGCKLAGLVAGLLCLCSGRFRCAGAEDAVHGNVTSQRCDAACGITCPGNASFLCGGINYIQLYNISVSYASNTTNGDIVTNTVLFINNCTGTSNTPGPTATEPSTDVSPSQTFTASTPTNQIVSGYEREGFSHEIIIPLGVFIFVSYVVFIVALLCIRRAHRKLKAEAANQKLQYESLTPPMRYTVFHEMGTPPKSSDRKLVNQGTQTDDNMTRTEAESFFYQGFYKSPNGLHLAQSDDNINGGYFDMRASVRARANPTATYYDFSDDYVTLGAGTSKYVPRAVSHSRGIFGDIFTYDAGVDEPEPVYNVPTQLEEEGVYDLCT